MFASPSRRRARASADIVARAASTASVVGAQRRNAESSRMAHR